MNIESTQNYYLSQQFACHTQGVRCLHIEGSFLISGSTDKTVKIFSYDQQTKKYELLFDVNFFDDYIYSVRVKKELDGFIVGSKDKNVYILDLSGNPLKVLHGHEGPVSSLSQFNQSLLISGSWDGTARIWDMNTEKEIKKLDVHSHAVTVLGVQNIGLIITGSQDGFIRFWEYPTYKEVRKVKAHDDIIREIQYLEDVGLLTSSNDFKVKIWTLDGDQISVLQGHSAFVFSCASIDFSEYASGSDDCSLKIWNDQNCMQTINHPGTVWSVTINHSNQDIITACSDGQVRVFVRKDIQRKAPQIEIEDFEKSSAVNKGVSNDELQKLPSVDQLSQTKGTKNGQVKVFRNGEVAEAYMWKGTEWEKIGEVLNQQGSSKKRYEGDHIFPAGDYDYVFAVDDDSGLQKKLPFNNSDNPLEVAEKYCIRESIHKGNVEQIRKFLISNSNCHGSQQAVNQQQQQQFQQQGNYQQQQQVPQQQQITSFEYFPLGDFITFEQMNIDGMKKKFVEINEALKGQQDLELNEKNMFSLNYMLDMLSKANMYHTSKLQQPQLEVFTLRLLKWPQEHILPVIDLFRVFSLHPQSDSLFTGVDTGLHYFTILCGGMATYPDVGKNIILKILCNLFKQTNGKYGMFQHAKFIVEGLKQLRTVSNQNVRGSLATFFFNVSAALVHNQTYKNESVEIYLQELVFELNNNENNCDNILRYLVACGNFVLKYPNVSKKIISQGVNLNQILGFGNNDQRIAKCCQELQWALK